MKYFIFFLIFLSFVAHGQNKIVQTSSYSVDAQSVWKADLLGNLYLAKKDLLIKYDTAGVKQFSQSIKSLGSVEAILPINTMKIVLFSEQQQTFTLMDNTLTRSNQTYDLSEMGFGYVHAMAVSSQPNKFWIYDQANSKLVLIDLNRTNQQQEITNFRGILNLEEVDWIKEEKNNLYLYQKKTGLYVFDLYGSLLETIPIPDMEDVQIHNDIIFTLKKGIVYRYNPENGSSEIVNIPSTAILAFQWVNDTFFVRTKSELLKYRFYL